jgi:hypothetical protein
VQVVDHHIGETNEAKYEVAGQQMIADQPAAARRRRTLQAKYDVAAQQTVADEPAASRRRRTLQSKYEVGAHQPIDEVEKNRRAEGHLHRIRKLKGRVELRTADTEPNGRVRTRRRKRTEVEKMVDRLSRTESLQNCRARVSPAVSSTPCGTNDDSAMFSGGAVRELDDFLTSFSSTGGTVQRTAALRAFNSSFTPMPATLIEHDSDDEYQYYAYYGDGNGSAAVSSIPCRTNDGSELDDFFASLSAAKGTVQRTEALRTFNGSITPMPNSGGYKEASPASGAAGPSDKVTATELTTVPTSDRATGDRPSIFSDRNTEDSPPSITKSSSWDNLLKGVPQSPGRAKPAGADSAASTSHAGEGSEVWNLLEHAMAVHGGVFDASEDKSGVDSLRGALESLRREGAVERLDSSEGGALERARNARMQRAMGGDGKSLGRSGRVRRREQKTKKPETSTAPVASNEDRYDYYDGEAPRASLITSPCRNYSEV